MIPNFVVDCADPGIAERKILGQLFVCVSEQADGRYRVEACAHSSQAKHGYRREDTLETPYKLVSDSGPDSEPD